MHEDRVARLRQVGGEDLAPLHRHDPRALPPIYERVLGYLMVLGLPVGLLYHFGFSIVTAFVMYLLVTYAWPEHLEVEDEGGQQR